MFGPASSHRVFPLNALVDSMRREGDTLLSAVKDLASVRVGNVDSVYGLAYARGHHIYCVIAPIGGAKGLAQPRTWPALVRFCRLACNNRWESVQESADRSPRSSCPVQAPSLVAQLLNEIVVSLGGSMYRGGRAWLRLGGDEDCAVDNAGHGCTNPRPI